MPEAKQALKENCGNCDHIVWHDLRIVYVSGGKEPGQWTRYDLVKIPRPSTGSCTHPLMKRHPGGYKLTDHECLFWKGGAQ